MANENMFGIEVQVTDYSLLADDTFLIHLIKLVLLLHLQRYLYRYMIFESPS